MNIRVEDSPAQKLETQLGWDDLVLPPATLAQIRDIENWIRHHGTALEEWGLKHRVKPGIRALFHGPSGTGKTLAATLLGKHMDLEVFRVDLSRVVSKYIGETEKNLALLFQRAEEKNWILFFDEADALFGKRSDVRDSHDRYANLEVAYLLQRIEDYSGLVILATNLRANIDDSFVRRMQHVIEFPSPGAEQRYQLWRRVIPSHIAIADDIDWSHIAARHELTGANIVNITRFCAIDMLAKQVSRLDRSVLEAAIQREQVNTARPLRRPEP